MEETVPVVFNEKSDLRLRLALDELDCIANRLDALCFFVRDGNVEFLFHSHNQLDHVEGIRIQIIHKERIHLYAIFRYIQLIHKNRFYFLKYRIR